jgi:hypothetical protein
MVVDKPIASISFENVLRTEEIERGQQTLVEETCLSVLVRQEETIFHGFHDPVACYMEYSTNQNLRLRKDCKLRSEDNGSSTSALDMDCFTPMISFQPVSFSNLEGRFPQQSQLNFQSLDGNQQDQSPENQNAVEEMIRDCYFIHMLEDPFAALLETTNNPNISGSLKFKFICNLSNELLMNRLWSKHVQRK